MSDRFALRQLEILLLSAAIATAICLIGWVDLHNNEPQPAALCIIVSTFILSSFFPRRPWLWAILIGLSIPLSQFIPFLGGTWRTDYLYQTPVAFIPALIGAYAGWLVRKGARAAVQ